MSNKKENVEESNKWHKKFAVNGFNGTWDLIDKGDSRTPDEDELMIHMVHSSAYHWLQVGKKVNFHRGSWIISKVYILLSEKYPEHKLQALKYAQKCFDQWEEPSEDNGFADYDEGWANEIMARANAANGNKEGFKKYYDAANESGKKQKKEGDKKYFYSELEKDPWFGMR